MTWKEYFTSSIGKKLVMSLTGISLLLFLLVHATVNGMIFFDDNGETFNTYAHFMSHNWLLRIIEVGLFAGRAFTVIFVLGAIILLDTFVYESKKSSKILRAAARF